MIPTDETAIGIAELRARLLAGAKVEAAKVTELQLDREDIRAQVAAGVVDGMALVMSDKTLVDAFWERGYEQLAKHSTAGAGQWLIKRAFTAVVLAVVTAGMFYLLRNGALK